MKLLFLVVVLTVAVVFTNAKEDDSERTLTEKHLVHAIDPGKVTEKRDAGEDGDEDEVENEIIDRETRSEVHKRDDDDYYREKRGPPGFPVRDDRRHDDRDYYHDRDNGWRRFHKKNYHH